MIARARPFFEQLGMDNNFDIDITTDTSLVNDENLKKYQVFLQLHEAPFDMSYAQQAAIRKFIEGGKGWVGIHAAGLTGTQFHPNDIYWQWFEDYFGGVTYSPHPKFQKGTVIMEDRNHPATKNMPPSFEVSDEWYEFNKSPRPNVRVLGVADEKSYTQNKPMGDHPIIWTNPKYRRMIYIGVGHDSSVCSNPAWVTLVRDAILWAGSKSK
jgi:type 1 glutamine amidotransferase